MAETAFGVTYDGPALADGRMPVRDLAPALLALGDAFVAASTLLYPERNPVALNIKATQQGSFVIDLILEGGDVWDRVTDIFSSDGASALVNLKELLLGGTVGVIALTKWLKRRSIKSREALQSGYVRLTGDDGATIEVPAETLALHGNLAVRQSVRKVIEPVTRDGVDRVEFRTETEVSISVSKEEAAAFDVAEGEAEPLLDRETEIFASIVAPSFKEDNKWRLSDGESSFYAEMADEAFQSRVARGESFRKGDVLHCRLRVVQSQLDDALHTERTIIEVLDHLPRPSQLWRDPDFPT